MDVLHSNRHIYVLSEASAACSKQSSAATEGDRSGERVWCNSLHLSKEGAVKDTTMFGSHPVSARNDDVSGRCQRDQLVGPDSFLCSNRHEDERRHRQGGRAERHESGRTSYRSRGPRLTGGRRMEAIERTSGGGGVDSDDCDD